MTVAYVIGGAILGSLLTMGILWYQAVRYYQRNF